VCEAILGIGGRLLRPLESAGYRPFADTIGALRATNVVMLRRAAEETGRDSSIFDYIESKD